jgi:hypothetical protein
MQFCPDCKFEYVEEIEVCPDCGIRLVGEVPEASETLNPISYVFLRDLPSRLYAEMLKGALEKEGIPCFIKGDDIGIMLGSYSTTSPVRVSLWVDRNRLFDAQRIAQEILGDL